MKSSFARLRLAFARRYCLDLAGQDPLIILGSGRSGTTWLAELCNYGNEFRYIFEPLNPDASPHVQRLTSWAPSATTNCVQLSRFLQGKDCSGWSHRHNRRLIANRRLVKEIRLNLALPWIMANLPEATVIRLVRNPLDVAASRYRLEQSSNSGQWVWRPSLETLLAESRVQRLLNDHQRQILSDCVGQGTVLETIADWCLNNLVDDTEVFTVYYENLLQAPEPTLRRIFQHANILFSEEVMGIVARSSSTARSVKKPLLKDPMTTWKNLFGESQLDHAQTILNEFNVSKLYNSDWKPAA